MTHALPFRALLASALLTTLPGCGEATSDPADAVSSEAALAHTLPLVAEPAAARQGPLLCETRMPKDVIEQCQPGQTLVFLPERWGNEQFPLVAVALGCDLTQQVVITDGGVVCTVKVQPVAPAPAEPPATDPVYRNPATIS